MLVASIGTAGQEAPSRAPNPTPYDFEISIHGHKLAPEEGSRLTGIQISGLINSLVVYKNFGLPDDALRISRVILSYRQARATEAPNNIGLQRLLKEAEFQVAIQRFDVGDTEGVIDAIAGRMGEGTAPSDPYYVGNFLNLSSASYRAGLFTVSRDSANRALKALELRLAGRRYFPDESPQQQQEEKRCVTLINQGVPADPSPTLANEFKTCATITAAVVRRSFERGQHFSAIGQLAQAELALGQNRQARAAFEQWLGVPGYYGLASGNAQLLFAQLLKSEGDPSWRYYALTARRMTKIDAGIADEMAPYNGQFLRVQHVVGDKNAAGLAGLSLLQIGETELLLGRPDVALTFFRAATPAVGGLMSQAGLTNARASYLMGLALLESGDAKGALQSLASASAAYDQFTPSSRDLRAMALNRFEGAIDVHLAYLDAAQRLGDTEQTSVALLRAGRSRLKRSLDSVAHRLDTPAFSGIRRARDLARKATAADQTLISGILTDAPRSVLEKAQKDAAEARGAAAGAVSAELKADPKLQLFGLGEVASVRDVQRQLDDRRALLIYSIGRDRGFAAIITRDVVRTSALPISRAALAALVARVRASSRFYSSNTRPFDFGASAALYNALIRPFDSELALVDHAIISTSPPLDGLSFAQLWDSTNKRWLVDRMATSLILDPSLLAQSHRNGSSSKRGVLGLGDPIVSGHFNYRDLTVDGNRQDNLPGSLPGAIDELKAIRAAYALPNSNILVRADATEANFRTQAQQGYKVIALATHALSHLPNGLEARPAIVFTPGKGKGPNEDGLMYAEEIEDLSIDTDLVILSACQTASGNGLPGAEALSGLAQAFFYAGARALVATQWSVESNSAAELMSGMASHIKVGNSNAESLRSSILKLKLRPATSHPAFWAPFVVVD